MFCILIKKDDKHILYTNEVFQTEKEAEDYAKRSKLKKKDDCRIVNYDYKYFNGVKLENGNR